MALNPACQAFIPLLSPFVDGELAVSERQHVERHLSSCRDCTGRVADFRAEAGLVRLGMEMLADEVDFKDFSTNILARVTPQKLPLRERWKLSLSEMFQYQRGPVLASLVGAAAALAIAVPLLGKGTPEGYADPQMLVRDVSTEQAQVEPVVMTTSGGEAIIWLVDKPVQAAPDATSPSTSPTQEESEELDMGPTPKDNKAPLHPPLNPHLERPEGGPL